MIVADCSAIIAGLLDTDDQAGIARILRSVDYIAAPEIADIEVLNALRRLERLRQIEPSRALTAIQTYRLMPLVRFSAFELMARVWEMRHNLTAYDAVYVILARTLGMPLYTRDAKLAAAGRAVVNIVLI